MGSEAWADNDISSVQGCLRWQRSDDLPVYLDCCDVMPARREVPFGIADQSSKKLMPYASDVEAALTEKQKGK